MCSFCIRQRACTIKLLLLHIPRHEKKENGKYSRELRLIEPAIHSLHSLIKLTHFFMKTTQCLVIFFAKCALSNANNASAQAGSLHMPKVFFFRIGSIIIPVIYKVMISTTLDSQTKYARNTTYCRGLEFQTNPFFSLILYFISSICNILNDYLQQN